MKAGTGIVLTHNGQSNTLKDWSRITGIKLKTLYTRLDNGWSIARTLDTHAVARTRLTITLPSGEQVTPAELADSLGIPRTTVYTRLHHGWPVEAIMMHKSPKPKPYEVPAYLQLQRYYRQLVRLVGDLRRDGESPSVDWFAKLDAILDSIWDIQETDQVRARTHLHSPAPPPNGRDLSSQSA